MKYRLFRKELEFNSGEILEFDAPENLTQISVEPTQYRNYIYIVGLESYGNVEYPKKKFKMMIFDRDTTLEQTVDYEPKVTSAGCFTSGHGKKYYCFLIS